MQSTNSIEFLQPDICVICLNVYQDMDSASKLPCRHTYHKNCLINLFNIGCKYCPICRLPYELDQITQCDYVFVQTLSPKKISVYINNDTDVDKLWELIMEKTEMPIQRILLLFDKKLILEESVKISELGIVNKSTIYFVTRMRAPQNYESEENPQLALAKKYQALRNQRIQEDIQKVQQTKADFTKQQLKNNLA